MPSSLITRMRQTSGFMRGTAVTVLIAFSMLILQPTVAAAQDAFANNPPAINASVEAQLSQTLQRIEQKLEVLEAKLENQQDSSTARNDLQQLKQTLEQLDVSIKQNFTQIEQHILDHQLDPVILARHKAMVNNYQNELAALLTELTGVETETDDSARMNHAKNAKNKLKAKRNKRSHQPFDPKHLPFQASENKARPPKETPEELEQLIRVDKPVQLAALELTDAMLAQASPSLTPTNEDLLPTEDVQITGEIKILAEQLEHHPVKIYNWVHNNIEYLPTYGSIQGSQMTLDNRRGNAFDTASLLIALLRASNIPARYAYGTVQVPIEKVMNWVGGVESPTAALELMLQGGIPTSGLAQGGVIKYAKFEHIWVEAWVDYYPSRGAINKTGDSWVSMDGSFKQYELDDVSTSLGSIVPFDAEALIAQAIQNANIDETHGSVTNINETLILDGLKTYQSQFEQYFSQNAPPPSPKQLVGEGPIISQSIPILAGGLPYRVISRSDGFAELPTTLRHTLTVNLYGSVLDRTLESPRLIQKFNIPSLNTKRLGITYAPSTRADADTLESFRNSGASEIPLYLISVKPQIKLDDQIIVEGPSVVMGEDQYYDFVISGPTGNYTLSYNRVAGDEMAFVLNGAGITQDIVLKRFNSIDPNTAAENLHQLGLNYWAEADFLIPLLARGHNVKAFRLPSGGLFTSTLTVKYRFGIPSRGYYLSRNIDIKLSRLAGVGSSAEGLRNFVQHSGEMGSYLESSIFEQVFNSWRSSGVSAMQILLNANAQGIPIYLINQSNSAQIMPKIVASPDVISDISSALQVGFEVIVPESAPTQLNWTGTGYILRDPDTGSGSYRIAGGTDGGDGTAPCAEPEPQPLVQAIQAIVLTAIVIAAVAALLCLVVGLQPGLALERDQAPRVLY